MDIEQLSQRFERLKERHPHLEELISTGLVASGLTEEFLKIYSKSQENNKQMVLRYFLGDFGRKRDDSEFFAIQGLRFILLNPAVPLEGVSKGLCPTRDQFPKSLCSSAGIKRTTYYKMAFEYSQVISERFVNSSEIQKLSEQIQRYYLLDIETARIFSKGDAYRKRINHYFPESCDGLAALNSLIFMRALIPEISEQTKAQDRLPKLMYDLIGSDHRSVPQALAFTDLAVMHFYDLIDCDSPIKDLINKIKNNVDTCLHLSSIAQFEILDLSKYFFLNVNNDVRLIGGKTGSSFQFNIQRMLEKEYQFLESYQSDYKQVSAERVGLFIESRFNGDAEQLRPIMNQIEFDHPLNARDMYNILCYMNYLLSQEMVNFDRSSSLHYSKVLPSVAKFKMGMPEPVKKDRYSIASKVDSEVAKQLVAGKSLPYLESLNDIFSTASKSYPVDFEEQWLETKSKHSLSENDKEACYRMWNDLVTI